MKARDQAQDPVAVATDDEARYRRALERADDVRAAWVEAGSPLTTAGSMGQEVEHPLFKLIRQTELEAAKLGELIVKRKPGRPVGASSARDRRQPARVQRLKVVK